VRAAEPTTPGASLDNPAIPGGFTALGQFIDHDLTSDRTPLALAQADPLGVTNFRSPRFDLDSVYGGGPTDANSLKLYDPADFAKLLTNGNDLPRIAATGKAILVEGRNDEQVLINQLHVAFLKFHNRLVDLARADGVPAAAVFETARQATRWHYQWMVVHDFLPRIIGQALVDQLMSVDEKDDGTTKFEFKRKFYKPTNLAAPMMPVEFPAAAYRFGHSMVRPSYTINATGPKDIFGPTPNDTNLNGGRPLPPALIVDWSTLFTTNPGKTPQPSRRIDSRLSLPLHHLPASVVRQPDRMVSLAERNLIRGKRVGLPSGQAVARAMKVTPLTNQQLGLTESGWGNEAPLWFYILKEAELTLGGQRLGAVGGRIIGEVFLGLLELDPTSYVNQATTFRPRSPLTPVAGRFNMVELLKFAGVA